MYEDEEGRQWDEAEGFALFGVYLKCSRQDYNALALRVYGSPEYTEFCELAEMIEQGTWNCGDATIVGTFRQVIARKVMLGAILTQIVAREAKALDVRSS